MEAFTLAMMIVVPIVVMVVIVRIARHAGDKRRAGDMKQWAHQRGWHYEDFDTTVSDRLRGRLFDKGGGHTGVNVVRTRLNGRPYWALEFRYNTQGLTDEHGNSRTKTHSLAVTACHIARFIPETTVEPRSRISGPSRIADKFLGGEFVSGYPAFDQAFRVVTANEAAARTVLDHRLCAFAVQYPNRQWGFVNDFLFTWHKGKQTPATAERQLDFLRELADHLPPGF